LTHHPRPIKGGFTIIVRRGERVTPLTLARKERNMVAATVFTAVTAGLWTMMFGAMVHVTLKG